ncbi:MAG: hypothetical protein IJ093_03890 [Bacilli bacterium]|nr:hypothetical protein [Bacilli bacterium]
MDKNDYLNALKKGTYTFKDVEDKYKDKNLALYYITQCGGKLSEIPAKLIDKDVLAAFLRENRNSNTILYDLSLSRLGKKVAETIINWFVSEWHKKGTFDIEKIPEEYRNAEMIDSKEEIVKETPDYLQYFNENKNDIDVMKSIPREYRTPEMYEELFKIHMFNLNVLNYIPSEYKTQTMCNVFYEVNKEEDINHVFNAIPSEYKTQTMSDEYFENTKNNIRSMFYIPNEYKTQEMCDEYFMIHTNEGRNLKTITLIMKAIPEQFRTEYMCDLCFNATYDLEHIPLDRITDSMVDELVTGNHKVSVESKKKLVQKIYDPINKEDEKNQKHR